MEDQGIMALPQAGMQAPTTAPTASPQTEAAIVAFDQARSQVTPKEFGDDLLSAAEQADPAMVRQFRQSLAGLRLPQELIDSMQRVVEIVLRDPQNYAAVRKQMISSGVPQDLLPEQFDPMFFSALRIALDQVEAETSAQPVQSFAKGGIANLRPIAKAMQEMGRGQDTVLAHINPQEARMLQMMGGVGTINPNTGLREYDLWREIAKPFESAGREINRAVRSVKNEAKRFASSDVGRVVTTIALGYFVGPAAANMLGVTSAAGVAAVSGFVGSAGGTVLAGGSVKQAIKTGVMGGLTAGALAGATGGMGAFEANSYTGPTTVAGRVEEFTKSLNSLGGTPTLEPTTIDGTSVATGPELPTLEELAKGPPSDMTIGRSPIEVPPSALGQSGTNVAAVQGPIIDAGSIQNNLVSAGPPIDGALPGGAADPNFLANSPTNLTMQGGNTGMITPGEMPLPEGIIAKGSTGFGAPPSAASQPGVIDRLSSGDYTGAAKTAYENTLDYLSPSRIQASGQAEALKVADKAYANAIASGRPDKLATEIAVQAYKDALPGVISQYGPMVAAGTGAAYLAGAFDPVEQPRPNIIPSETGFDLYEKDRDKYGVTPGGSTTTYAPSNIRPGEGYSTYFGSSPGYDRMNTPFTLPQIRVRDPRDYLPMGLASLSPRRFNLGGFANGGATARKFPRRTGQISGPGTETSDSIPAMLSDGEFVMTAQAVRGAGNGSRREGAKRMYQMMRKFERKA